MNGSQPTDNATLAKRDQRARGRLRKKLGAEGCDPALIDKLVEAMRVKQLRARLGDERASRVLSDEAPRQPDDRGYKPAYVDPLLRGAGRATGDTAKSVRLRRGLAAWETETA